MNPEIFKIISYAINQGMEVRADSNLNHFNKEMADKLVKSGMTALNVSIDGASPQTYLKYRQGGDFNQIINNIKLINKSKKKYGLKKPFLTWQFIIFGHNEHEIEKAKAIAKNLDMNFKTKLNCQIDYSPPKNKKFTREYYQNKYKEEYIDACSQLWYGPVINWGGNMLGCCNPTNEKFSFGNVFK